jgi:nucleotide-binding universal stress UspA family protein
MHLAGELACAGGTGITLLHVVELPTVWGELRPFDADRELGRRAGAQLEDWAAELAIRVKVPVTTRIAVGSPGAELPEVLGKDLSFDLVVIGSHGRTGLSRVALGSIAERVVRHAPCRYWSPTHAHSRAMARSLRGLPV